MTGGEVRQWLRSQDPQSKAADLWDRWTQELWKEGRKQFMAELGKLTPEMITAWAIDNEQVSDEAIAELCRELGCERSDLEDELERREVSVSVEQRRTLNKIANYAYDKALDVLQLIERAKTCEEVASALQKNPTKQNPYEPLAATFISERSGRKTVQLASKEAHLQIRFQRDGSVAIDGKAGEADSKSADLLTLVEQPDGQVRAILSAHKFARVTGGHQDNQRRDAIDFLNCALEAKEQHPDIPKLRALAAGLLGREVSAEQFSWEPALILDGKYFAGMTLDTEAFVGDSDGFVSYLESLN